MDFLKPRLTPMNRRRRIYEGKAKVLYEGPEPGTLIQHFKDDATAFNAKKHQIIDGKGVLNNRISEYIFQHLNNIGVPTHFIRRLNMREQLIKEVEIIPLEIDDIMALAIRVNDFLSGLFLGVGIRLVDFKMETGRLWEGDLMRIVVADEISPDSCRLWDVKSSDKMDKDRFRRDLGGLVEAYTEVARRLGIMQENDAARSAGPQLVQ